jgi:hypothetical protein
MGHRLTEVGLVHMAALQCTAWVETKVGSVLLGTHFEQPALTRKKP